MIGRRELLVRAAGGLAWLAAGRAGAAEGSGAKRLLGPPELPAGTLDSAVLQALPGKDLLVKRSYRPPNYETPLGDLSGPLTDNRRFFVRYHLLSIPEVDPRKWKLRVGGEAAEKTIEVDLEELRTNFEPVELVALCLCSGNRRGLSNPHVPGVQWGYGAMGNARWKGARLRDVLAVAGLRRDAVEVAFDGADAGIIPKTPDFVKSLPVWRALDENTLVAYEMNGEPLPRWHGSPARLVVPGWTATYWVKHLVSIDVLARPFDGFWMKTAYRIPRGLFPVVDRFVSQETDVNTPITEILVSSLITSPQDGHRVAAGQAIEVRGIAWDGGYGISRVEVSSDGGRSWTQATFGADGGLFSWRTWTYSFRPPKPGSYTLAARATNRIGGTQTFVALWNPAGYHHNAIHKVDIAAG